jgi:hypothetical protein
MKSALSLTLLIVGLVESALPVAAQERLTPTAGPIARVLTSEAGRLAAIAEPPSAIRAVELGGAPARSDWTPVRQLRPGGEIVMTVKGSHSGNRYFVLADESALTVLNLTDPTLPGAARNVLRGMATYHTSFFAAPSQVSESFEERDVRVGRNGVFVAGRKVTDLGQVVEHIARTDVLEIQRRRPGALSKVRRGALIGVLAGVALGVVAAHGICGQGEDSCGAPFVVGFTGAGAGIGAGAGAIVAVSHRANCVYRAP